MTLRLRSRSLPIVAAVAMAFATVASGPASATGSVPIRHLTATAPLTITTTALPPATVGYRYSATLQATGGTAPYLWTSSRLPSGLVLSGSGVLSGTARDVVTTSVVFYLIDSLKNGAVSPLIKFATLAPLSPSGQVFGWGANSYAQLGTGDEADRLLPVPLQGLSSVAAIAGGLLAGYALKADGTMWDWGTGNGGELGDGTFFDALTPKVVPGMAGVRHISGGAVGPLVALSNRTVWGWGYNSRGELGINCPNDSGLSLLPLQISGASSVVDVALNFNDGYELSSDGTVWGQGLLDSGQLGTAAHNPQSDTVGCPVKIPGLTDVTAIAAGEHSAYALRSDGTVWAWGDNSSGELGIGSNGPVSGPVQMSGLPPITAISAGGSTGYALAADGTVWAWGSNSSGAVGDGRISTPVYNPVRVTGLTSVTKIVGGQHDGYALRSDGTVWAWGSGSHGQLGTGTVAGSGKPMQVKGLTGIVGIGAGPSSSSGYAIKGS